MCLLEECTDFKMAESLEAEAKTEEPALRECGWCPKTYDYKKRQEQVMKQSRERGVTTKSHAAEYCSNHCWFEADKTGSC